MASEPLLAKFFTLAQTSSYATTPLISDYSYVK